jgi:hypothetical protein
MSSNINIIPGESVILFTSSTGNYNAVVQDNDGTLKFTGKTAYSGSATFYSASTNNTNQGIATLNSTTKNLELRDLKTIINREWKEITGTTYTTVAGDETKWLIATNAGGCRIDYNGNVFDDGDEIIVTQYGVGQVIVVSGPAPNTTTIESPTGFSNTREQYSTIFGKLYKTPNVLVLGGQLKDRPLTIVTETSERTFALGDENTKYFRFNKETPVTATVPKNSAVAFDIGSVITIEQQGAGVVTVAPVDGDVTINAFDELKTAGQYAVVKLIKVGTDVWTLIGGASGGGGGGGGSNVIEEKNSGYTILLADKGKIFTCNSTSTQTFNLPSVSETDIGTEFTIIKLGVGQVIIDAADSDTIEDSGPGDTIYCSDETYAIICVLLVSATEWVIKFANGTWITTD